MVLIGAGCQKGAEEEVVSPGEKEKVEEGAEKNPLWRYFTTGSMNHVYFMEDWISMSSDGSYTAAIFYNWPEPDNVLLFKKDSSVPLWNYQVDDLNVESVSVSSDGNYIAAAAGKSGGGRLPR